MRGTVVGLAAALLLARAAAASTASPSFPVVTSVAIVAPGQPDAIVGAAVSRLRSELGVVGLASHTVTCADEAAADARACARTGPVASAASEKKLGSPWLTTASIAVAREDGVVTLEVIERLGNGSKFFRLVYVPTAEGGNDPAVLAIRGVELLRDVHLDVERTGAGTAAMATAYVMAGATTSTAALPPRPAPLMAAAEPPATQLSDPEGLTGDAPAAVATSTASPAPAIEKPWVIHASLGVLQGRGGVGPSVGPALGGTFRIQPRWALWTTLAGPFYADLSQDVATAATRQELAMVGTRFDFGAARARPFVTAGAGLYHLRVEGSSSSLVDTRLLSTMWAPLLAAGAGCSYPLGRLVDIAIEAQALVALPGGVILIRGVEVGHTGAPSVLAQAELRLQLP